MFVSLTRLAYITVYSIDICRFMASEFVLTFLHQRGTTSWLKNIGIEAMNQRRSGHFQTVSRFLGFQYYLCDRIIIRISRSPAFGTYENLLMLEVIESSKESSIQRKLAVEHRLQERREE